MDKKKVVFDIFTFLYYVKKVKKGFEVYGFVKETF